MLENFNVLTFAVLLGDTFEVEVAGGKVVPLELIEAKEYGSAAGSAEQANGKRAPFSILFRSSKDYALPQATYPFVHPSLGRFEMFIVPVQPDQHGNLYQAIFT